METVKVGLGFVGSERGRIAALYWEAFGRKLRPGFTNEAIGQAAVKSGLRSDRMFVARRGATVLGICGFCDIDAGAVDLTWSSLRQTLSISASLRAGISLVALARVPRAESLVLDGLCVDSAARGLGVGTALLNAATNYALQDGKRSIRLSVIDNNPRARALYERLGFTSVDGGSLGLLSGVYGFASYTTMELEVNK